MVPELRVAAQKVLGPESFASFPGRRQFRQQLGQERISHSPSLLGGRTGLGRRERPKFLGEEGHDPGLFEQVAEVARLRAGPLDPNSARSRSRQTSGWLARPE